jgi:hypothetical protein
MSRHTHPTPTLVEQDNQCTRLVNGDPQPQPEQDPTARALLEEERRHLLFRRLFVDTSIRYLRNGRC